MALTIVGLTLFYLVVISYALYIYFGEMPRFLKDMPSVKDWFKMKTVRLQVSYVFPNLREVEVENKKTFGQVILHYIRVRAMALSADKQPPFDGNEYGVTWSISKP